MAQNFRSNFNSDSVNFINITRSRKNINDIFCDTGKFMNKVEIDKLNKEINSKIMSKMSFFILFSWSGGPRTKDKTRDNWSLNENIVFPIQNIYYWIKSIL